MLYHFIKKRNYKHMNINPLYLQEVSREYYEKILNKSPQHKVAAKLTKRWLKKNPTASREDILDKLNDFSEEVHDRYDTARKRQWDNTFARKGLIFHLKEINRKNPWAARRYGTSNPEHQKDKAFKEFRDEVKDSRKFRLKKLENSKKK